MTDNEFLLHDRLTKIKSVIEEYGEDNFYISFSGGKDSTVLSALVDMAIPDNTIPRVYANTGIEYRLIVDFVERERERQHPWELVILKPSVPIKPMLEKEGYPFKSKEHSLYVSEYQRMGERSACYSRYLFPEEKRKRYGCPKILRYQFTHEFDLKISNKCCNELKKKPLKKWMKENYRTFCITGMTREEQGSRNNITCINLKSKKFHPLAIITKEWEEWFINEYNIAISDIYKEPYNFPRTGCKGCPFAIHLQEELDTLEKYFPNERKQCEIIWKPVYDEYRRLGYRLKKQTDKREV
jgi:3'-phosphoadenosine 5'-phosphosulfate sulfotransferase (PAPS reductase)/FAD synthetase